MHLTPAGYEKLGEKLADITVADSEPKKREQDTPQPDSKFQRPRLDNYLKTGWDQQK